MTADTQSGSNAPTVSRARRWLVRYPRAIPLAIFIAIAAITALGVYAVESNARAQAKAQVDEYAEEIAVALDRRGNSVSAYLRSGAALFSSLEGIRPQLFRQFVAELRLDVEYRGTQGIGWIDVTDPAALIDHLSGNVPAEEPPENAETEPLALAPVTLFSPDSEHNRLALGFDMASEPVRAAALEQARRTVRPTASGRLVLAKEDGAEAPGFIIFMPVYKPLEDTHELAGFVYSPFNAESFLDSAIDLAEPSQYGVRLYDGALGTENLLVSRSLDSDDRDVIEQPVTIANRQLVLVVEAPRTLTLAPLSMITLLFGIAVASLLMLLARLLTRQAMEDQSRLAFYEEQHSIRNSLTRELNHRVKNTLANVLSIMSLTRRRTDDLDVFADSLEGRVRALSATHDLLTGSDWGTIPIRAVVEAEIQHFLSGGENVVSTDGPTLELAPNNALTFGLAIHELATNAAKYGALSVNGGSVSVQWRLLGDDLAEVEWCEKGGPAVAQSGPRGFGTELIERVVAHELKQPVDLSFDPEGVRCVMRVPIRQPGEFQIRSVGGES